MQETKIKDYFGLGEFFPLLELYPAVIQPNKENNAWYEYTDPITEIQWDLKLSPKRITLRHKIQADRVDFTSNFPVTTVEDVARHLTAAGVHFIRKVSEQELEEPCTHPRPKDAGVYGEGLGTIHVEWCPDCGALHRKMINWTYKDYNWEIPKAVGELRHDLAKVKEYLGGEWTRGALSGPMGNDLISIMNKGKQ